MNERRGLAARMAAQLDGWGPVALVLLAALAATATSLGNLYAYDDSYAVAGNPMVQGLTDFGTVFRAHYWFDNPESPLYRPLVVALWRAQWALGNGAPWLFHLGNTVLAAAVAVLVLHVARRVLPGRMAIAAALLFAVHPVHVEVTGNVVGQSELLVAVAAVGALGAWIDLRRGVEARRARARLGVSVVLASLVGYFSKEHALAIPALLLLAELTVLRDAPPLRRDRAARLVFLLTVLGVACYLLARNAVVGRAIGEEVHTVFMVIDLRGRIWTMLGIVPEWLRLLFFPNRHAAIPGPPDVLVMRGPDPAAIPGMLGLVGIAALAAACWRAQPVVSFGVLMAGLFLLPVSNIFYRTGILYSERSLFLPSVGAMLALGGVADLAWTRSRDARSPAAARRLRILGMATLVLLACVGAWRSARRQRVWYDSESLFAASVIDTPRSYRAHDSYGSLLRAKGEHERGRWHLLTALDLLPLSDPVMLRSAGDILAQVGRCDEAIRLYAEALRVLPEWHAVRVHQISCLLQERRFAETERAIDDALRRGVPLASVRTMRIVARQLRRTESGT